MSVSRSRILDLMKVQCRIFSATFNPERLRTGNKVLRQRLKGHILAQYYPRKVATVADFQKYFKKHDLETYDEDEIVRLADVDQRKARGKGAPKKIRTKVEKKGKGKKK